MNATKVLEVMDVEVMLGKVRSKTSKILEQ